MSLSEEDLAELARVFDVPVELLKRPGPGLLVIPEVLPDLAARLIGDECPPSSTTRSCSCWHCSPPSSESAD